MRFIWSINVVPICISLLKSISCCFHLGVGRHDNRNSIVSKIKKNKKKKESTEIIRGYIDFGRCLAAMLLPVDQRWKMICFLDKVTFSTRFHFIKPMNLNYAFRMLCGKCWVDMKIFSHFFFLLFRFYISYLLQRLLLQPLDGGICFTMFNSMLLIIITIMILSKMTRMK